MLFSGLEGLSYNLNRKNNDIKLFEFGNTYHKFNDKYAENKHLSLFVTGNKTKNNWTASNQKSDFFYFKGIVMTVLERLGFASLKSKPTKNEVFSEGINLSKSKIKLVDFGVVNKNILTKFGIKQEVFYADFDFNTILSHVKKENFSVTSLPKYPSVKRDLALLVDNEVSFKQVYNIAFQTENKFLEKVDLFDVYQGKKLPDGKKSYAVSFILQDDSKTLEDKQIDKIMQKLQDAYKKQLNAELR
jgi:phenylalanyl-tRNA synthetase beta chain